MRARQATTVLDHNCWMLAGVDGNPYDPVDTDEFPHYDSKDDAVKGYAAMYRRYEDDDLAEIPLLVPLEMDSPCYTLTTVCGYVLDEANDGICHQDDPDVLVEWGLGVGQSILADGRMVCSTDPRECRECAAAAAGVALAPVPAPGPGQLTLDGGVVTADGQILPDPGPLSADAAVNLGALRRLDKRS